MLGKLWLFVKSIFEKEDEEGTVTWGSRKVPVYGSVHYLYGKTQARPPQEVRIDKPLQYVKQHGNHAEYSAAKRAANAGNGRLVRDIANTIYNRKG